MSALFDLVFEALAGFAGLAPERPLWLRRLVQGLWLILAVVLLAAAVFGFVSLAQSLS